MPSPSPLNWLPDAAMSIEQAVERANALLAAATSPQPDGRVRPTLDDRTMRYYQTLGIVPPPPLADRSPADCSGPTAACAERARRQRPR